jgi:tyrosyl-tRNA synthetase
VTVLVHGQQALETAQQATQILFGKATKEALVALDEQTLLDVFEGVEHYDLPATELGRPAVELLTTESCPVFPSRGEMRKMVQGGGVSLNKEKMQAFDRPITSEDLIDGKYLLVQKGKKNYYLLTVK